MLGYIEAIEARLHKMEGLLGGLVKDKDPRAEIVRAELDAMAREAEMTGLKLRRSKAYEEINQAMAAAASEAMANGQTPKKSQEPLPPSTNNYSETHYQHQHHHQHQHQHQSHHQQHHQYPQHPQHHHKAQSNVYSSEGQYVSAGYPHRHTMETHTTIKDHEDYSTSFFGNSQGNSQKLTYSTNESELYQPSHHHSQLSSHRHYPSHSSYVTQDMRSDNHSSNYDPQSANFEKGYSHQYHTHQPSLWTSSQPPADLQTRYTHNSQSDTRQDTTEMPSREVVDHLLAVYFRHIHPVLPMLHYPTLSDQIRRQELPPSHLLFAILGLASRFSENNTFRVPQPGYDRPPCTLFYEKAKYLFKEEYDNSQIGTVQALLLMAVQQMGFCESQRAWLYVGMAIRMAQDLGLNKDLPEHEQVRNRLAFELRKRTWWSCYVVERLVCAGLGRPLTITQKECETTYPQHDDDIDLGTGALAGKTLVSSNFVYLITLSKIQGNILEFIKARAVHGHVHNDSTGCSSSTLDDREPTIDISQAAFFALDKALTAWRQDLPEFLQTPTADSPHFGLFLHMTYNTLIILLHRPEVSYSATSTSLCTQAAATITEITEILMDAKALTSTFISCLYAIFSAGVVHFMNIPSPKRPCDSNVSSPRMNILHSRITDNHTTSAKANMKRCIDALKVLASHWVSAARRAKVLEDLLDLKHVSLKDLEVDSFKTTAMEPSWAKASTGYGKILESPREGHDKLRQQCRSKMMAIHSLLADDNDDYPNAQHWDDIQHGGKDSGNNMDMDDNLVRPGVTFEDTAMEVESAPVTTSLDSSPSAVSDQSPVISIAPSAKATTSQLDTDPMMLMSTTHLALNDMRVGFVRATSTPLQASYNGDLSDPMMSEPLNPISRSTTPAQQGAMFDPFSMPSSIAFPSLNQGRRMSCGGNNLGGGNSLATVWSTDAQTNRSTAWSGTAPSSQSSSPRSRARTVSGCQVMHPQVSPHKMGLAQQMDDMGFDEHDHDHDEEHDLVWNDMPPTLGLDEWMAYIGAMMMRWLASGESSPRSVSS
ncbi:hypothetical protein BG003_011586 [Podila horticola]|nr:hypothetical protein BG003_011586 [Podila horticola]